MIVYKEGSFYSPFFIFNFFIYDLIKNIDIYNKNKAMKKIRISERELIKKIKTIYEQLEKEDGNDMEDTTDAVDTNDMESDNEVQDKMDDTVASEIDPSEWELLPDFDPKTGKIIK